MIEFQVVDESNGCIGSRDGLDHSTEGSLVNGLQQGGEDEFGRWLLAEGSLLFILGHGSELLDGSGVFVSSRRGISHAVETEGRDGH